MYRCLGGHNLLNFSYDGGSIGGFISDAIRNINAGIWSSNGIGPLIGNSNFDGALYGDVQDPITLSTSTAFNCQTSKLVFDASLNVPTSHENRPASFAARFCISY